jgi:hypothetical protein
MIRPRPVSGVEEDDRVLRDLSAESVAAIAPGQVEPRQAQASPVAPFILGTVVGGLAGAALGTALSPHTRGFVVGLYQLVSRRMSSSERDQLRFELLLQ